MLIVALDFAGSNVPEAIVFLRFGIQYRLMTNKMIKMAAVQRNTHAGSSGNINSAARSRQEIMMTPTAVVNHGC